MSSAYVVSGSMIPMGRYPHASYPSLAVPAARAAIAQSGLQVDEIREVYCGHAFGGMLTGQRIAKGLGIGTIPVTNVDNACSGGATALHAAVRSIEDGRAQVALVIGVDKLTQFGGGTLPLVNEDPEVRQGIVMPAIYAMRANRYLFERQASVRDLAMVSVKARRHGSNNPYAQYRTEVTIEEVLSSRPVADPLTLLQCCPTGDGAAALVVVNEKVKKRLGLPAIKVRASVLHSGSYELGYRDMLTPEISARSAIEAYEEAGAGPDELDLVELHDAFSIAELIYYEALGLCEPGESANFLRTGQSTYGGKVVVNPSGGLLSKGHPIGASGVAQVVECLWQLTNHAGSRQVDGARLALTHVTGGGISGFDHGSCAIHVLEGVL